MSLLAIPYGEFTKHFEQIIRAYDSHSATKFIAYETTLMIVKFFLALNGQQQSKDTKDVLHFLVFAIYLSNLQIKEELRVCSKKKINHIYT